MPLWEQWIITFSGLGSGALDDDLAFNSVIKLITKKEGKKTMRLKLDKLAFGILYTIAVSLLLSLPL